MEEILNFISQNYVYIPASIISALAVIIPAVVKIAKIVTNNTATTVKVAGVSNEVATMTNQLNGILQFTLASLEDEKAYIECLNSVTINKREKELNTARLIQINDRIKDIKNRIFENNSKCTTVPSKKEKRKVRVKVVKEVAESLMQQKEAE